MKIRTNDTVKVITGKSKGKEGKVLTVFLEEGRAVVEGVNVVKLHRKPRGDQEGGIVETEKPVDISNLMLVCPNCKEVTRVGFKFVDDKKHRYCKKCEEIIE